MLDSELLELVETLPVDFATVLKEILTRLSAPVVEVPLVQEIV